MIKLDVPYQEKDEAKSLGARWNPELRAWTIEDDQDPGPFAKWLPKEPDFNVRADTYSVVRGHTNCWKCGQTTDVFGVRIDSGSHLIDGEHEELEGGMLLYVEALSGDLEQRLSEMTEGRLRKDYSKTTDSSYIMNHCRHCGAKQGDHPLHNEIDGPFYGQDVIHVLETVFEELKAEAGVSMPAVTSEGGVTFKISTH